MAVPVLVQYSVLSLHRIQEYRDFSPANIGFWPGSVKVKCSNACQHTVGTMVPCHHSGAIFGTMVPGTMSP